MCEIKNETLQEKVQVRQLLNYNATRACLTTRALGQRGVTSFFQNLLVIHKPHREVQSIEMLEFYFLCFSV